jgi:ketosteroid isomerase-like protein
MPPAQGQRYRMPGAAFFTLRDGRIRRVSDHYNLQEWFSQVAQA